MKKRSAMAIAALMITTMATTAMAATTMAGTIDQDSNPQSQNTEITTNINPTYVISIPANTNIAFNDTTTTLGTIKATHMQIEPNKQVKVSATAGVFANEADAAKTIPYQIMSGEAEFTTAAYIDTTKETPLTLAITEENWNKAYAGTYKGIITFDLSYEAISDAQ